ISTTIDRSIDTLMPPLLRTPATVSVAPTQRDALGTSLAASRAFPQVTRDFKEFLDAQAQLSYATRGAAAKVSDNPGGNCTMLIPISRLRCLQLGPLSNRSVADPATTAERWG
ncbi:hypothetical protein XAXN_13670, partial [Xanthomonas axonopodis]